MRTLGEMAKELSEGVVEALGNWTFEGREAELSAMAHMNVFADFLAQSMAIAISTTGGDADTLLDITGAYVAKRLQFHLEDKSNPRVVLMETVQ